MLIPPTYTNTPPPAAPILPGATPAIRRQAVLELIRLRRKLTGRSREMAYFSRASVTGRPLTVPVATFAAIMLAKLNGYSRSRAEELINANPEAASPRMWHLAARAHAAGCRTSADFEKWIGPALAEAIKEPII